MAEIQKHFTITGYKTIEFRKAKTSGSTPDTVSRNEELRSETLKLNVTGYSNDITANIDIVQTSQASGTETKQQIQIDHPNFSVILGEFQADFATANLLEFQQQIDGIRGIGRIPDHQFSFMLSKQKGTRRTERQKGNNSQGPYQVLLPPVVVNSEIVAVDNRVQERDVDYRIDYTSGKITFLKTIVTPYQEITLTYDSSTTDFSDRITGYRYQFSGIPGTNTTMYYLQKREQISTDTSIGAAQSDIAVLTEQMEMGSWLLKGELGLSKYNPNIVTSNQSIQGPAGYFSMGYHTDILKFSSYISKISNDYTPLNSYKIHPGDFTWGMGSEFSDAGITGLAQIDVKTIHENDVPIEDKESELATKFKLYSIDTSWRWKQRDYISWPGIADMGDKYIKNNLDHSSAVTLFSGKLVSNIGLELYRDIAADASSYHRQSYELGYSISPVKDLNLALDTAIKLTEKQTQENDAEKHVKLNGNYQDGTLYTIDGYYDWTKITDKPDITIYNMDASLTPIKEYTMDLALNDERLNELLNQSDVDTEKINASIRCRYEPIRAVKLDISYKPKFKQRKSDNLRLSHYDLYNAAISFPVTKLSQASYLFKRQDAFILQTKFYPNALLKDNIQQMDTHIARWRILIWYDININTQYEIDLTHKENLLSTDNAVYQLSDQTKEIKKIEAAKQWNNITFGVAYENTNTIEKQNPTANIQTHKTTGSAKITVSDDLSITPKFSALYTSAYPDSYSSINPEILMAYTWMNTIEFTAGYSYLQDNKPTGPEQTHTYTSAFKAEITKTLIVSLDALYETHPEIHYSMYEISAKGSVFFNEL